MKLSLAEVDHVADLARLALSDQERELFRQQLSAILDYAERLQQLDSTDVLSTPPATTGSALQPANVLRDDEPRPSLPPADLEANAPAWEDDCFRVPPVLEDRG